MEKLSLEKFLEIKNRLSKAIEEINKDDTGLENTSDEELYKVVREKYLPIQAELYGYDLSDIPFEAWQDVMIVGLEDDIADFSKTRANIDFNIVGCDGYVNFKGCNLRNIDRLFGRHYPEMFDEEVIKSPNKYFLSDIFSDEFKNKYYNAELDITDLTLLSTEQINELSTKQWHYKLKPDIEYNYMLGRFPLEKSIQLYKHSKAEYDAVGQIVDIFLFSSMKEFTDFIEEVKGIDGSQIKDKCFDFIKKNVYSYQYRQAKLLELPQMFKDENPELYLEDVDIPDDVRERYFARNLTLQDYLNYTSAFDKVDVEYMIDSTMVREITERYGSGEFKKLVANHRDVFEYLVSSDSRILHYYSYWKEMENSENAEMNFTNVIKQFYIVNMNLDGLQEKTLEDGSKQYILPDWLSSLNLVVKEKIVTEKDLLEYDEHVIIKDRSQLRMINMLNIDNIRRFNAETGFFTNSQSEGHLLMLDAFENFSHYVNNPDVVRAGIDFNNGKLSYEEFKKMIAKTLDHMRGTKIFTDYPNYEWMNGSKFSEEYPELFIDKNAPEELRKAFYMHGIKPGLLHYHPEYIPYLLGNNLKNTIMLDMKLLSKGAADLSNSGVFLPEEQDFITEYSSRYGNEKTLRLIAKYGEILSDITIINFHDEIEDEEEIEKVIQEAIHDKIINKGIDHAYLEDVTDFVNRYPDIFVNFDGLQSFGYEPEDCMKFKGLFFRGEFTYDTIKQHPKLIPLLKDKNLYYAFRKLKGAQAGNRLTRSNQSSYGRVLYSDLELLTVYGNEIFLELCSKYGSYLDHITDYLYEDIELSSSKDKYATLSDNIYIDKYTGKEISYEELDKRIEATIIRKCREGIMQYDPNSAPEFLKRECPDLFLDEGAPEQLKLYFYNSYNNYPLDFKLLSQNREWLNYLNGKALKTSLLRNNRYREGLEVYFQLFGEEKGIKLGISRAETVCKMLADRKVELMKQWYDKTGGRFIPDYIVMQNFSIEEADKFLTSGSNWSALMKIKRFANDPDGRDAMLKLAYSFGAFDHDQRGFKKLMELLTDIPRKIGAEYGYIIDDYSRMMEDEKRLQNGDQMDKIIADLVGGSIYLDLHEAMKKEKVNIDYDKPIFEQIYRKNEDGSYSLTFNPQMYPKTAEIIRTMLEDSHAMRILDSYTAHRYFGGFKMEYDPDFREFFLENYDKIMNDDLYLSQIAAIQRRFKEIKAVYSNVVLTLDLAISYINDNRYELVNPGNERVTKIAAIQGYSQEEFNKIQRIYNHGKQRVFSSIPRVESKEYVELKTGRYHYEMLRLDDPRAMSIGYESDCCQRLGQPAEMCMEHSMVDKNGRVFVITNELGEVVAQSWVWRNKDVLCFDNIEVPDQKMWDNGIPRGSEDSGIRNDFTDDILTIYKMATHELIEEDERVYRELLESGKITQEQYDGLRLGKITTGEGYSNIKGSLRTLPVDRGHHATPLAFNAPVELRRGLYSDASIQYIIEEREDRKEYNGDTPVVHADSYIEYDDTTFTESQVHSLERLESVTKDQPRYLDTSLSRNVDKTKLVSALARNYGLHQETTRIILHPNFAIIYDTYGDKITIGDLLFNTKIDNFEQQMDIEDKVIMQIRLALNQIANGKEVILLEPTEKQQQMYDKIMGLKDEMDIERGVGYVR